jgi:hypothetical protein
VLHFNFLLTPLDEVPAWGEDQPRLSWFGLTDGWFWITVGDQELFRYTQASNEYWRTQYPASRPAKLPYEYYMVARYWEDLLEILPAILDPLPEDLAVIAADAEGWQRWQDKAQAWQKENEDEDAWDTYNTALRWWGARTWAAIHLAYPPDFWLWRVGDFIHLRWDNRDITVDGIPVWETEQGEFMVPVTDFLTAIHSFHDRLLSAMQERVQAIMQSWSRPEVQINIPHLQKEQQDRSTWLENALTPLRRERSQDYSWGEVREAIATISAKIGPP